MINASKTHQQKSKSQITVVYTYIYHDLQKYFNLNLHEYAILNSIYILSRDKLHKEEKWCYASRETLGKFIGISPRGTENILVKLEKLKLIEYKPKSNHQYKRTTDKWNMEYIKYTQKEVTQSAHPKKERSHKVLAQVTQSAHPKVTQSATNSNSNYNNNNSNITVPLFLEKYKELTSKNTRKLDSKTIKQLGFLKKEGYSMEDLTTSLCNALKNSFLTGTNDSKRYYLTPEYITREDKFLYWLEISTDTKKEVAPILESKEERDKRLKEISKKNIEILMKGGA